MYCNGDGVPQKNYVEGYKWLSLSAQHGRKQSLIDQEKIAAMMTKEQIAEANREITSMVARQ